MRRTPELQAEARVFEKKPMDVFGVVERPKVERTSEQAEEIKRKIGFIARVFSRNYDMEVYPSPQGGWACALDESFIPTLDQYMRGEILSLDAIPKKALQPTKIYYDLNDVDKGGMSEDEIMGVMRHEIGHSKNTDYRLLIEGQKSAHDDGNLPSSWASAWNACEDPWVNNKEIGDSETVREKMTLLYRKLLPEIVEKINTQPASWQLGLNIIHYWLTDESIPTIKDKKLLELFDKIKPAVDAYFNGETAAETHKVFQDKIWPVFKDLEKKSLSNEEKKEMMRQMSDKLFGAEGEKSDENESKENDKSIMDKIKKKLGLKKDSEKEQKKNQQSGQPGGQPKPGTQEGQETVKQEMERQEKGAKERNNKLNQSGNPIGELPDDIDLSSVPDEVVREVQKAIDALSPEQKKELAKKARERLDKKLADQANKKLPKTSRMKKDEKTGEYRLTINTLPEDKKAEQVKKAVDAFNKEQDEKAEAETKAQADKETAETARREAKRKEDQEKQQMEKDGFDPATDRDLYLQFKALEQSMDGQITSFMRVMERYLPRKEETEYGGEATYIGKRISPKDVIKRAPVKDYRVMLRRQTRESEETRLYIALLIDKSGSMQGQKMEESLKTAIFFGRVLKRFGIPFAIKFFGDHVDHPMAFADDYDDPKKHIKKNLMAQGRAVGGSTDMSTPLMETIKEMVEAKRLFVGSHGGVFIISDSGANAGPLTGQSLQKYIKEQQKTFSILNLLLSNNSGELAEAHALFGKEHVIQAADFGNLPNEAFKVLRITLERVLKTFRSIT